MSSARIPIVVIAGPTASGKTDWALAIAERCDGELIGADSVQVYRGFDIGTGKPSLEQRRGIPHHLIDVIDATESIDAARYAELADAAIGDVHQRGKQPIVVGGTGLWLRALLRGLVPLPTADAELRADLERRADREGLAAMYARLAKVDPLAAARLHRHDRLRVLRALEVFEQTGTPLGEWQRRHALGAPRYDARIWTLELSPQAQSARIEARVDAMLQAGWVDETQALLQRYGSGVRPLASVGYKQLVEHLQQRPTPDDRQTLDISRTRIIQATRAYARHQRTWFRGAGGSTQWVNAELDLQTRLRLVDFDLQRPYT